MLMAANDIAVLPPLRGSLTEAPLAHTHRASETFFKSSRPEHKAKAGFLPFGADGPTFLDFLDIVNPLQHLPIIGSFYRKLTGDTLDPVPRIVGSTLFFGPLGGAVSSANLVLEQASGRNFDEHVMAFISDGSTVKIETEPSENALDPIEISKTTLINEDLSNASLVTSWARSELSYRQRLSQASKVLANKVIPPGQIDQSTHSPFRQVASAKLTPVPLAKKHGHLISETKPNPSPTGKYSGQKPMPNHVSLAAAAYKAAVNRVSLNLSLPNEY